jgi:SAM-dependent methyltransferase
LPPEAHIDGDRGYGGLGGGGVLKLPLKYLPFYAIIHPMERYSAYDNFAWLYNEEWGAFGENIFPALKDIAKESLPENAKVLDLCCGTGQLAKVLTNKGYKVTGIDGSANQLKFARKNAPNAKFILADARTFKLPPTFNAAFSTFDSLNHIMKLEELQATFKNVNQCLVIGGIFIFDMTTKRHFETRNKDFKQIKETPEYFYALQGDYNEENKIAQIHCTIFQCQAKGWQRSDVSLQQTHYPSVEIKKALKKAGFTDIRAYSASPERGLQKPTKNSLRLFFFARKS